MFGRKNIEAQIEDQNRRSAPDLKVLTRDALESRLKNLIAHANAMGSWDRADIDLRDRIQEEIEMREQRQENLKGEKAA